MKLYCVDSYDAASWSDADDPAGGTGPAARPVRVVDPRPGRAVDLRRLRRAPSDVATLGCSLGAFHAANFALRRADLFPLALCLSGNYDPATWHGVGRARRRRLLQQPDGLRRAPATAITWTGCAADVSLLLVCGQGQWEDTTGSLPSTTAVGRAAGRQGHPARAGPVGLRRRRMTGRPGAPSSPITCRDSADAGRGRPLRREPRMQRHLIGLLLGTEEDWPRAFESCSRRLGPVTGTGGTTHAFAASASPSSRSPA